MNLNYKESAPSPFLHADYGGDGGSQRGDNIPPLTAPPLGRKRITNSSYHSMHKSLRGGRTGGDGYVPFLGMAQRELVGSISTGMSLPTTSTTTTGTVPTTGDTRDNPWQTNGGSGGEIFSSSPVQSSSSSGGGAANPVVIMFSVFFFLIALFLIVSCAKTMTGQSSSGRKRITNSSYHSMHKSLRGGRTGGDGYVPFLGMAQRELVGSMSTMSLPTTSPTTIGTVPTAGGTRGNPWQTNGGSGGEGYEWKPSNDNDDSLRPRSSPGQVQSIQSSPSSEGGGTNPGVIMSIMFSIFFVFVTLFLIVACAKTMTGQSSSRRRRNGGHDAGGWFGAPVGGDGGGWFGGSGGGCD
eukprot:CAMPEP_0202028438 /NCGR_PEP_ID=MMETSP0905-20130828/63451_1 /ASSEMBLY_ACC=CAM_ASM_000554 /TAXON_ID=420261 /ORGANISM="Thalassiosira antarctica, Strain CCMP982" /LENGTH=351 /DNA_ID=CAMNT_0048592145 /DNA_START=152 /DNA_END=1204 /DNA_ORIENTATION=-